MIHESSVVLGNVIASVEPQWLHVRHVWNMLQNTTDLKIINFNFTNDFKVIYTVSCTKPPFLYFFNIRRIEKRSKGGAQILVMAPL